MNQQRKKFWLSVCVLATCIGAFADDAGYVMQVNLTDGTTESYLVADHPTVKFDSRYVTVTCKGLVANYLTEEVSSYTFVSASEPLMGDVNGDGLVNLVDITDAIDAYLADDASRVNLRNADFDGDGAITVNDITDIIDTYLTLHGKKRPAGSDDDTE